MSVHPRSSEFYADIFKIKNAGLNPFEEFDGDIVDNNGNVQGSMFNGYLGAKCLSKNCAWFWQVEAQLSAESFMQVINLLINKAIFKKVKIDYLSINKLEPGEIGYKVIESITYNFGEIINDSSDMEAVNKLKNLLDKGPVC
jgi:hypothetical protein